MIQDGTPVNLEENVNSGASAAPGGARPSEIDRDLARIIAAWPSLPEPIRRALLALIG